VRRFRRWLDNDKIEVASLYGPLIQQALAAWGEQVLYGALDTSMLWKPYCLIRISVIYRGRAVPLVWTVLEHGRAQVCYDAYRDLLNSAVLLLPRRGTVIFLADRGFADTDLMRSLQRLAVADTHQEQLLALSPWASTLQGRASRGGAGAGMLLASSVHHGTALWAGASGGGTPSGRQRVLACAQR
jgi:hypothetical protein